MKLTRKEKHFKSAETPLMVSKIIEYLRTHFVIYFSFCTKVAIIFVFIDQNLLFFL